MCFIGDLGGFRCGVGRTGDKRGQVGVDLKSSHAYQILSPFLCLDVSPFSPRTYARKMAAICPRIHISDQAAKK